MSARSMLNGIILGAVIVLLAGGCSSGKMAADASAAAGSCESGEPGPAPLRYFIVGLEICSSTYDEALANLSTCPRGIATCTDYRIIGTNEISPNWTCYYDINTGELIGAHYASNIQRSTDVDCWAGLGAAGSVSSSESCTKLYPDSNCHIDGGDD